MQGDTSSGRRPFEHKRDASDAVPAEMPYAPVDVPRIERAVREILLAVGEDPDREGLLKTPNRVARSYAELMSGLRIDPREHLKTVFHERYDEIVLLRNIEFHSLCEHHLLPFTGRAHVAYLPDGKVVGLSKLARLVEGYARRPQVQERLTTQIADALMEELNPIGAACVIEAIHTCMTIRGAQETGKLDDHQRAARDLQGESFQPQRNPHVDVQLGFEAVSPGLRKFVVVPLLIIFGFQCWLVWGRSDWGRPFQLELLLVAAIVSLIPPINRPFYAWVQRIRQPSLKMRCIIAIIIAVSAACLLCRNRLVSGTKLSAQVAGRAELSRAIPHARARAPVDAAPRAGGFLRFVPAHRRSGLCIDVLPRAALFYTPAIGLHLPFWVISIALCGVAVGMIYLITSELIDGWAGLLAVLMVLGTSMFRKLALMIGGHPPLLALRCS